MTLLDTCAGCGHPRMNHLDHLNAIEKQALAIAPERGCVLEGCGCEGFVEAQTPAGPAVVVANNRQLFAIAILRKAIIVGLQVNWDNLPTHATRGLHFAELTASALIAVLAQGIAGATLALPDGSPNLEAAVRAHVDLMLEMFRDARKDLLERTPPATEPAEPFTEDVNPRRVLVPAPKAVM